jgi:long-subunit fatty acid transport protein
MTIEGKVYVGDVGTEIKVDMQESMSGATDITFEVKKPSGEEKTWSGVEIVETTKLKYTIQSGDLDVSGTYKVQPKLTLGAWIGKGYTVSFRVYEKYT